MTNTTLLFNYLTYTLIPALHEKRIYIDGDAYRVSVTDCSKAGAFVHVDRMGHPDDWSIVATPAWDGATTTIPVDVHHDAGEVTFTDNAVDVAWTGKLDYDVQIYLHTVRAHIVKVILPALWPDSTEAPKTRWIVCLDDGETWGSDAYVVRLTDREYDRLNEGEKVRNVVPDYNDEPIVG